MIIGYNILNGKPVELKEEERTEHMHVIGTTGAGKSKLLEHMIREDIKAHRGLCLIDPHGSLYHNVLKYVTRKRLRDRVILIDPNDEEWAVGINYLEHDPNLRSPESHASEVMKGIAKVFGGEDTDVMPRLQRWQKNTLTPLISRKLTVLEMAKFVDPDVSYLRKLILEEVADYDTRDEWERFENAPRRDRESYVEAVFNRARKFTASPTIRRIFGQVKSTVDFKKAMDEGKVVLCNLACTKLADEERDMLGVVILDKIIQAGLSRGGDVPEERLNRLRPFYVYLDEFWMYVSEDIARALWQLRKFQVRMILAHQELEQLKDPTASVHKVLSAVLSEPQVRLSFRVSRQDAEVLAKEMFTGKIKPYEKRRIEQTKFRPVETTRTIRTATESEAEGESEGWGEFESAIESAFSSMGSGATETYTGEGLLIPPTATTISQTSGTASGSARGSGSSYMRSKSSVKGRAVSEAEVPWYEYHEFKEVSSIEDYTVEELLEKFIAWIKTQPDRRAQLKIKQKHPVPIITPDVKDLPVWKRDIKALKEYVYSKYALPAREADKMIEARRMEFLQEAQDLGLVEVEEVPELTPESMRHK